MDLVVARRNCCIRISTHLQFSPPLQTLAGSISKGKRQKMRKGQRAATGQLQACHGLMINLLIMRKNYSLTQ